MSGLTTKQCNTCGTSKPETAEHFYFRKETGRFRDQCKDCFKQAKFERYWRDPEHARRISMDSYYATDGAAKKREAVAAKPELYASINARYEAAHREERLEARRAMHEANREAERIAARARYAADPQKSIDATLSWMARHPERARANAHRVRAKRRAAPGAHTEAELLARLAAADGTCVYCRGSLGDDMELDHIQPLSRGGSNSIENLVYACRDCNQRKFNRTLEQWLGDSEAAAVRERIAELTAECHRADR